MSTFQEARQKLPTEEERRRRISVSIFILVSQLVTVDRVHGSIDDRNPVGMDVRLNI